MGIAFEGLLQFHYVFKLSEEFLRFNLGHKFYHDNFEGREIFMDVSQEPVFKFDNIFKLINDGINLKVVVKESDFYLSEEES